MNVTKKGIRKMKDQIIKTSNKSVIQHGKYNDRIYLMKLDENDLPSILEELNNLARENNYGKIFAKVPLWAVPFFKSDGYITEAYIPRFIKGEQDIHFVSKFLSSDRLAGIETGKLEGMSKILQGSRIKKNTGNKIPEYNIEVLNENDAVRLTNIFKKVFKSYPFPIHDPEFIIKSMRDNTVYFGIRDEQSGEFRAVSSSEVDTVNLNAEMTDFAVLESERGKKFSIALLKRMEEHMKEINMKTLYTIARLNSPPMNKTFLRMGYRYTGTLIKNTNISGNIESMNVLYKSIV